MINIILIIILLTILINNINIQENFDINDLKKFENTIDNLLNELRIKVHSMGSIVDQYNANMGKKVAVYSNISNKKYGDHARVSKFAADGKVGKQMPQNTN